MKVFTRKRLAIFGGVTLVLVGGIVSQLPAIGAGLVLHPFRRHVTAAPPEGCRVVTFEGDGVILQGWRGEAEGRRRGTLIYLHGVADNRASAAGVLKHFRQRGFDVVGYDSRAHGDSGGAACTYGFLEKRDLERVIDTARPGPIVLIGSSLGAAVALQTAAADRRISAVVAAEVFSDLRTVVTERAPFFFSSATVAKARDIAERKGGFRFDDVSPVVAAASITAPVLLIHGEADRDTLPDHSRRVFAALTGSKRLILVPGARHNESLSGGIWQEIENWLDGAIGKEAESR